MRNLTLILLFTSLLTYAQDGQAVNDNASMSKYEREGVLEANIKGIAYRVNLLSQKILESPLEGDFSTNDNNSMSKYERIGLIEKNTKLLATKANEIQAKMGGKAQQVSSDFSVRDDGSSNTFNRITAAEKNLQTLEKQVRELEAKAANYKKK